MEGSTILIDELLDPNFATIVKAMSSSKKCVIVTGAGISVTSGIPVSVKINFRILDPKVVYTSSSRRNIQKHYLEDKIYLTVAFSQIHKHVKYFCTLLVNCTY